MSSDALGALFANWIGINPPFLGSAVSNTYTAAGAIALTDRLALLTITAATTFTLADGVRDGQPLVIKNLGTATATITAHIDGAASGTIATLATLRLIWCASQSTWLSV